MALAVVEPTVRNPQHGNMNPLAHGLIQAGIQPHASIDAYKKERLNELTTRRQRSSVRCAYVCVVLMLALVPLGIVALILHKTVIGSVGTISGLIFWITGWSLRRQGLDWNCQSVATTTVWLPDDAKTRMVKLESILPGVTFSRQQLTHRCTIIFAHYGGRKAAIYWD